MKTEDGNWDDSPFHATPVLICGQWSHGARSARYNVHLHKINRARVWPSKHQSIYSPMAKTNASKKEASMSASSRIRATL